MEVISQFTSWPPYLPEGPRHKMNKRLVCLQSRWGNFGRKFCSLPGSNFGPAVPNHTKFSTWRIRSLLVCSYIVPPWCNTSPYRHATAPAQPDYLKCNPQFVSRTALFWSVGHCVVIIPYRRFGITYRCHIEGSRILKTLEDEIDR